MKKYRTKFIGTVLLVAIAGWSAKAQESNKVSEFDLEECVSYALENNSLVLNAKIEEDISSAQVKEYTALGLPQVSIGSGLNYNYILQRSIMDVSNFDATVPEGTEGVIAFGQKYDGNIALGASQLIFDGSFFVGLQAAKTVRELSSKKKVGTEIELAADVAKAYYALMVTEEQLTLLKRNSERLNKLLEDTKIMYEQGFVEKIDLNRIKVQANNLQVQLENTTKFVDVTRNLLKFQMGLPVGSELFLKEKISDVKFITPELIDRDFDYNERIEYSQLQTSKTLVLLDMKSTKVQYLPNIYANYNYGYITATSETSNLFKRDRWFDFSTLGVSLNVPVFDGFYKRSKIQRNKLQFEQLENSENMLKNSIDLEINTAKTTVNNNVKNMQSQLENMELAEEVFHISEIKYKEGMGSNSEVLDADTALKQAQTNYYNALYEALVAKIDLEKAYGTLLENNN